MPIPRPRSGENRSQFISRCVSAISDEYEQEQATAICIDAWGKDKELYAVNTPQEQLDWYWKTIDRKRESFQQFAAREFNKALQAQFDQFYEDLPDISLYERNLSNITSEPLEQAFQRVYQQVAGNFAANVYRNMKSQGVGLELKQDGEEEDDDEEDLAALFFNAIKDFVSVSMIEIIESSTQRTKRDIEQLMVQIRQEQRRRAREEELRRERQEILEEFQTELQAQYKNVALARATIFARTEIIRASNKGMLIAANATNIPMTKMWVSTRDSRVRRPPEDDYDHWTPDGQKQSLNEPFMVSNELLQYPADPVGSPGNTINCRCTLRFQIRTDVMGT